MNRLLLQGLAYARRHPSAQLLAVQLAGIALYPWLEGLAAARAVLGVFGLVVLGAALWVVRRSPFATWLAALLAVLVIGLYTLDAVWPSARLLLCAALLEAAFYFYAAGGLIAYMMEDERTSRDELFAVGATFTVLAWAFAYLYLVCQWFDPASFSGDPQHTLGWMDLLFLSFTCLSGVGLGDVVPHTAGAKAMVMLEEFAGVMYLALVVSRVIALTLPRRR